MTDNPVAREIVGYLLVRGEVHVMAYVKALENLTGIEMTKLLPIPNLENKAFSETRKFEEKDCTGLFIVSVRITTRKLIKYGAAFTRKMDNNLKKSKTTKLLPSERYSLVFLLFCFIRWLYCFKNTINLLDHTKVALDKNYCECTIGITQ